MKTNFTPGPWHVVTIDQSIGSIEAADYSAVAQAQMRGTMTNPLNDERKANAAIIAASPELYESLGFMTSLVRLKYGNLDEDVYQEILKAEAALKKATNQS